MYKTVLASLTGFASDRSVLDAAVAVARQYAGHIECLHTRIDPMETAAMVAAASPHRQDNIGNLIQKISEEQQERSRHARSAFEEACKRHALRVNDDPKAGGELCANLVEITGIGDETLRRARFHDLAVMARDAEISSDRIEGVLMQAGRPVLIAPAKPVDTIGQTIAVAWKEGPDAARALLAATPMLARAKQVVILCVPEIQARSASERSSAEHLSRQLRWHGIQAQIILEAAGSAPASAKIKELAYACGADLLAMGAFGHSRMREFVFGGVTRDILRACEIPVFMFH